MLEKIRKNVISYCIIHSKINICKYILFKLVNKEELSKLIKIITFIAEHKKIKGKFYG